MIITCWLARTGGPRHCGAHRSSTRTLSLFRARACKYAMRSRLSEPSPDGLHRLRLDSSFWTSTRRGSRRAWTSSAVTSPGVLLRTAQSDLQAELDEAEGSQSACHGGLWLRRCSQGCQSFPLDESKSIYNRFRQPQIATVSLELAGRHAVHQRPPCSLLLYLEAIGLGVAALGRPLDIQSQHNFTILPILGVHHADAGQEFFSLFNG